MIQLDLVDIQGCEYSNYEGYGDRRNFRSEYVFQLIGRIVS